MSNEVCATDEFKCKTGGCKWNGPNDCHPSSTCIPKAYRCDINNEEDCTDGSDEIGCTSKYLLEVSLHLNTALEIIEIDVNICK